MSAFTRYRTKKSGQSVVNDCILKVAAVDFNGEMHAMVLEYVEEITERNQRRGYEVGDRRLIFKNTYYSKEYGKEKKFTINAKDEKSPDVFYYIQIDVDLEQLQDVHQSKIASNDPATPFFEISEEPNNESACAQCLYAFTSCFNC